MPPKNNKKNAKKPQKKTDDNDDTATYVCCVCDEHLLASKFNNTQLERTKRGNKGRCRSCMSARTKSPTKKSISKPKPAPKPKQNPVKVAEPPSPSKRPRSPLVKDGVGPLFTCCGCEEKLPKEKFNKTQFSRVKKGNRGRCRQCISFYNKERRYSITRDDYEEMVVDQDNTCSICNVVFTDNSDTHVDHCHKTGEVRGLLCVKCNTGLGKLGDDIDGLIQAMLYLARFHAKQKTSLTKRQQSVLDFVSTLS